MARLNECVNCGEFFEMTPNDLSVPFGYCTQECADSDSASMESDKVPESTTSIAQEKLAAIVNSAGGFKLKVTNE